MCNTRKTPEKYDKDKANRKGNTPLYITASKRHDNVVRQLLAANCDTDKAKKEGNTPLFIAAIQNNNKW